MVLDMIEMTDIDAILKEYEKDSKVNPSTLESQMMDEPSLHAKYIRYLLTEKHKLVQINRELKKLKLQRHEFYAHGPSKDDAKRGVKKPPGIILAQDKPLYLEADEELLEMQSNFDKTKNNVEALTFILNKVAFRSNTLKNILEIRRWEGGG